MTYNPKSRKWQLQFDFIYELMSEQLNNEESIGNAVKSRTQVDQYGNVRNKISGPSTRNRINARMYGMVEDWSQLCESCRLASPLKNGTFNKEEGDEKVLSTSGLRTKGCILCDIGGFLNAVKGGSEKRESVYNVSDAIAEVTGTRQRELHSRLDQSEYKMNGKNSSDGSNNMIFHEENRNSTYHQTVVIDLDRVGLDDHRMVYVVDREQIKERICIAVKGVVHHFMDIHGANTSAHKPHLLRLEGSVRELTDSQAVNASYSTMAGDYLDVQQLLNNEMKTFNNPAELMMVVDNLLTDDHMDALIERNVNVITEWQKQLP